MLFNILLFTVLSGNQKLIDHTQDQVNVYSDVHSGKEYKKLITHQDQVGMIFNSDGISPFKSSRLTIWPIYLAFACLPPNICMNKGNLVTCAFWLGQSKPCMKLILKPLKNMLSSLKETGVTISSSVRLRLQPLFGVFDLVAKAPILNMMQFNGLKGCPVCLHPGTWERTRLYLPGTVYSLRTNEGMMQDGIQAERNKAVVNGIKGQSVLSGIIDLVNGSPIDYMHCVLEGIMKKLLEVWVGPRGKISSHLTAIDTLTASAT